MQRIEHRGVVVLNTTKGESHKQIGLYTEEGMKYFTIYGARSSKGHSKSNLSVCAMGRFVFNLGAREKLNFVDVDLYESCISLSNNIDAYYSACCAAELSRAMLGEEHKQQFKLLVDFLLYIVAQPDSWLTALLIFLWNSLICNGWHPQIDASVNSGTEYISYSYKDGFIDISSHKHQSEFQIMRYTILDFLLKETYTKFLEVCDLCNKNVDCHTQQIFLKVLFDIWHDILGYKLKLSNFVLH